MQLINIFVIILFLLAPSNLFANDNVQDEQDKSFDERGMGYAKFLHAKDENSAEGEKKQKLSEALNNKIREKTIAQTQELLAKYKNNPKIEAQLLLRLAYLNEKQAEGVQNQNNIPNKEAQYNKYLQTAIAIKQKILKDYKKWVNKDDILFTLAENNSKLKNNKAAELYYLELIRDNPNSPIIADTLLALGNLYFDNKSFTMARQYYSKILNVNNTPLKAYGQYKIAWCLLNENHDDAAKTALVAAIKLNREQKEQKIPHQLDIEEEALNDLVLFYSESGDPNQAKEFFESILDKERAKEYRYRLAKRYYEIDKHNNAKIVVGSLLVDNPPEKRLAHLYLIQLSIAEKIQDRKTSLAAAERLAGWTKQELAKATPPPTNATSPAPAAAQAEKTVKSSAMQDADELEVAINESEENLRRLSQRIHFDAQKYKLKDTWLMAKKSYEIYLDTFTNTKYPDVPEQHFRYATLLMHLGLLPKAYENFNIFISRIDKTNKYYHDAMKFRIECIETANEKQKTELTADKLIAAYDAYVDAFPNDPLSPEAAYKAARISKKSESLEKAAVRFRLLAEKFPKNPLAKDAIKESLGALAEAKKWDTLQAESTMLLKTENINNSDIFNDKEFKNQILAAKETAALKIAEEFEAKNQFEEAAKQYLDFIDKNKDSSLAPLTFAKLANMAEFKMFNTELAIDHWKNLKKSFPNSKEAKNANIEIAKLYEKRNQPVKAASFYLQYSKEGTEKTNIQALTNAAVILDLLAERELAASTYATLYNQNKSFAALQSGCNNLLLSLADHQDTEHYEKLLNCSKFMIDAKTGNEQFLWKVRAAWLNEKLKHDEVADHLWQQIAKQSTRPDDPLSIYVAEARLRNLAEELENFKLIKFTKTNEKPEANLQKKTKAMDLLEKTATHIAKLGTAQQANRAKAVIRDAYLDFAETLEKAALPSKLPEADRNALKQGFLQAANDMKQKSKVIDDAIAASKNSASTSRNLATADNKEISFPNPGNEKELQQQFERSPDDPEIIAQLAYGRYADKKYGEANYIANKWQKALQNHKGKPSGLATAESLNQLQTAINQKISNTDPITASFL